MDVTGGFEIAVDYEIIRSPDRYRDERGTLVWRLVTEVIFR